MTDIQNRDSMKEILKKAAIQDRTVIEFQNREDGLVAFEVTDHLAALEEIVENQQQDEKSMDYEDY